MKSLRGGRFKSLPVAARGFAHDREWMVIDANGRFLTQRQEARMALIDSRVEDGRLVLNAAGMSELVVAEAQQGTAVDVIIWEDRTQGLLIDPDANVWLSEFLGQACRLVRFPERDIRRVDPNYAGSNDQVGYADGFPFLLISQASLDDLNTRLEQPLPMLRFRPNLVVSGSEPYEEDSWRRIRIGEIEFRVAKPCSRCIIPTIDPASAERTAEPLRTLMTYRRRDNKIYFGQNLLHNGLGELSEGMPVEILERDHD